MNTLVFNKYIRLEKIDYDKYGRILADIYVKNKNISPRLKKLKKVILLKSPYKKKPVAKSA